MTSRPFPRAERLDDERSGRLPASRARPCPLARRRSGSQARLLERGRCPARDDLVVPHPAIRSMSAGSRSLSTGWRAEQIARRRGLHRTLIACDGRDLLGEVDPRGAPGDAATAADTTGLSELVPPCGQLVGEPLPIPGSGVAADASRAVQLRMAEGEARIPSLDALDPVTIERVDVLRRAAEARRAHECAVRAGQATLRDVVPSRVIEVRGQHIAGGDRIETACHLVDAERSDGACGIEVFRDRFPGRRVELNLGQYVRAALGPHLDQQLVRVAVEHLGDREVMAVLHGGPGAHRGAEARARGVATARADEERLIPGPYVRVVRMGTVAEHPVVDGDRCELARLHADERIPRRVGPSHLDRESVLGALPRPQRPSRRREEPPR